MNEEEKMRKALENSNVNKIKEIMGNGFVINKLYVNINFIIECNNLFYFSPF